MWMFKGSIQMNKLASEWTDEDWGELAAEGDAKLKVLELTQQSRLVWQCPYCDSANTASPYCTEHGMNECNDCGHVWVRK
jgi:hypothetical protein